MGAASSFSTPAVRSFVSAYAVFAEARRQGMEAVFARADLSLTPLTEPLRSGFVLGAILRPEREESYSDILKWLLEQLTPSQVLALFRAEGDPAAALTIDREVRIQAGRRRLDLVLRQGSQWCVVIEVKTRGYGDEDLEKHADYERVPGRKVFLALEDSDKKGGFEFLSWEKLCLQLRRMRPVSPLTTAALYMALLGAIEQNMLGLGEPTPRTFDYLCAYLEETNEV